MYDRKKRDAERASEIKARAAVYYLGRKDEKAERSKAWYLRNSESRKAYRGARGREVTRMSHLKKKYGITVEDYDRMLIEQSGRCEICETPFENSRIEPCVDHCHASGGVRGLLCNTCNTGLGFFDDSPDLLNRAALYVIEHLGAKQTA